MQKKSVNCTPPKRIYRFIAYKISNPNQILFNFNKNIG